MWGGRYIKAWSKTMAIIALSSGEAELVALTKAIAETMGLLNMMRDLGCSRKGVVYADSSAALAIADRKGSGKLRHINVRMLWVQEKERTREIEMRESKGEVNPADLMTKYLLGPKTADFMRRLGQYRLQGRADAALEVQGAQARRLQGRVGGATPSTSMAQRRMRASQDRDGAEEALNDRRQ